MFLSFTTNPCEQQWTDAEPSTQPNTTLQVNYSFPQFHNHNSQCKFNPSQLQAFMGIIGWGFIEISITNCRLNPKSTDWVLYTIYVNLLYYLLVISGHTITVYINIYKYFPLITVNKHLLSTLVMFETTPHC